MSLLKFRRQPLRGGHWLHLGEAGPAEAPTLLFVHGAAGCWHNFRLQIEWLQQDYHVVTLDLRGHGLSPWPGPSRVEDFVDDLAQVAELFPGPMALIGHSFGGGLATYLGPQLGARLKGLALLNTAGEIPPTLAYRALMLGARFAHLVQYVNSYWLSVHGRVAHSLLWKTLPGWKGWALLPQLRVPSVVIAGRYDSLIPWKMARRAAESLPDSHFHLIKDGRHVSMWEHPQVVRDQLEGWLSRCRW